MFGALSQKLQGVFSGLAKQRQLTEDNISEAIREVRVALLEADVNYTVSKNFVKNVKEKAIGQEVIKSVSPAQQFIKIVHDELVALMGANEASLNLNAKPAIIMLCGLQGAGKTTQSAKLANLLKKKAYNKKPLLAACDLQRPAAVEQLKQLGNQINVPVVSIENEKDPVIVAKTALQKAKDEGYDVLIIDTAGRLHIDEELMQQLQSLYETLQPQEVLFVANAMMGQDAVNTAAEFSKRIAMTGSILTMLDSNARAGAAISICDATKQPLKFEGHGEKIEDLQVFNPASMADRILGMGDVINLVKKAQENIDEDFQSKLEDKVRKGSFTYDDFLSAMSMIKKMGPLKGLLKMIPGFGDLPQLDGAEDQFKRLEAMICSMTKRERQELDELEMNRRRRIARGSGVGLDEVNRMVKTFKQMKQLMKNMPNMKQLQKMMGGF
ncbi:MAG: ffh [Chlamydiales bacterium]|jgi:signal recognition particle subunit SRP54|nr:ffh [Chlamydiales bacterium]